MIRAGAETRYADVFKVLRALDEARVGAVTLDVSGPEKAAISANIRVRSDTPYSAVVRTVEALKGAGVGKTTLSPGR